MQTWCGLASAQCEARHDAYVGTPSLVMDDEEAIETIVRVVAEQNHVTSAQLAVRVRVPPAPLPRAAADLARGGRSGWSRVDPLYHIV